MKLTNIHDAWGSVIEFDNPLDFFNFPKGHWRDLIYQRKLLIFKKMNFTPIDYGKFSLHFGRPWNHEEYFDSAEEPVSVTDQDNKTYSYSVFFNGFNNSNNKIPMAEDMSWHADLPHYKTTAFPFRSLWMIKKPQNSSGNTYWLNIEDCFDLLSPKLKELAGKVKVIQQNWHRYNTEKQLLDLIKVHPITGKKSLRLNFYATPKERNAWIVNVLVDLKPLPDCNLIQDYIDDLLQYKQLYHSHTWDLNDIAIYDNYSFIHGRNSITFENNLENSERKMYRMNINHMTAEEFQKVELPPSTATSAIK